MKKNIIASLALGLVLAASAAGSIIGCGGGNNGGSGGTGGGGSGGGGGGNGTAGLSFVCAQNPTTNDELLNSCAPAGVDSVNIDPFYPSLAPNGQLPALP